MNVKKEITERKWSNTENRFVAYFDIMGFKDYVYRHSHEEVKKIIMNPFSKISKNINTPNYMFHHGTSVKSTVFSDSLLLISRAGTISDLVAILTECQWVLVSSIFTKNIPLKGGISHGLFTADFKRNLFFGKPLIDIYSLVDNLQMYGCVLDNNVEKFIFSGRNYSKINSTNEIFKYYANFKFGQANHFFLNWCNFIDTMQVDPNVKIDKSIMDEFYYGVAGQPRIYIDNTVSFIEHYIKERDGK